MIVRHVGGAGEDGAAVAHVDLPVRYAGDVPAFHLGEELVVAGLGAPGAGRLRRSASSEGDEAE